MSAVFVTGDVQVGKSTLLKRVIDICAPSRKIYGFCTKKLAMGSEYVGAGRIYIYPATREVISDDAHCVGEVFAPQSFSMHSAVFEDIGVGLLSGIPEGSIVLMDELGFLESFSPKFCNKVMEILNGDYLVLGAIKPRNMPFLNAVREHKGTKLFEVTSANRESLVNDVSEAFRAELETIKP